MNRKKQNSEIFLEDRVNPKQNRYFSFKNQVDEVIAWNIDTLYEAFSLVSSWQKKGWYIAGFVSYDAGLVLHDIAQTKSSSLPLLHFVAYKDLLNTFIMPEKKLFQVSHFALDWSEEEYAQAFHQVKNHIKQGDTYQLNLTSKYHFDFQGNVWSLYQILREVQQSAYSGLLVFEDYQILTLSPELFFSKNGNVLRTKPMKGTAPRGNTSHEDDLYKHGLREDDKSKAENTIIVDLLRNDMSRICAPGSVVVSKLFEVETYQTLHQMTSTIEGLVPNDIALVEIFRALFPCGSITGAPKKRTMELIDSIEKESRGVYTGAIGYILPDNNMCFNVSIRTIVIQKNHGELGLGGGIIYDSALESEYAELKLKGHFFSRVVQCADY